MSDTTASPTTSTAARILALKDAAPAGPVATAKTTPPVDQARLLQILIDLIAEQRQATTVLQGTVTALTTLLNRCQQELPASCREASSGESQYIRAQLAVLVGKLAPPEAEPEQDDEDSGTTRTIIIMAVASVLLVIGAVILGRYVLC